ncbi:MAG: hypothetical protein PHI47_08490 [Sulfuricurvum sp.]|uniref:hypothetical protein n=1 Tax=Sulfuricurvum sp. TaxID=2025608 RepID=UPI00261FB1B4|nr:hypothetical protein [Sulfuricurvum sp.]MDD5160073.1 hypothetical protein [Sulfuricurvum sp.]
MKILLPAIHSMILLLCAVIMQVHASEDTQKEKIALIQPIEQHAIIYGEGERKIYVFVDPKCPHSRDFITMINENAKMRGIYRYYIFFYELKRFHSHNLIATLYASSSPLQRTLEVMVGGKEIVTDTRIEPKIEAKIDDIARVADTIGISKRPYLIILKENK